MNLSELRDIVRSEANIQGLRENQNLIDNHINQEFQRFTGRSKYPELLTSTNITLTAAQQSINLPANFQLLEGLVYQKYQCTHGIQLGKGLSLSFQTGQNGTPKYYSRFGQSFNLFPSVDVQAGDTLILSYYKKPELLVDADELQVPSLETAIIQAAISRILRMTDSKRSVMARQEAERAFVNTRAESQGS